MQFVQDLPEDRNRNNSGDLAQGTLVDLWWAPISAIPVFYLNETLTDAEKQRAANLVDARARSHFVAGRILIRKVLGGLLDVDPVEVKVTVDSRGKPFLACKDVYVSFSVSHTENLVALAVRENGPVGIDVECCGPTVDFMSIARAVFTRAELSSIADHPHPSQAFLRLWTAREAVLKAAGHGWPAALQLVPSDVPFTAYQLSGKYFWVQTLLLEESAQAAVAIDRPHLSLRLRGQFMWS